MVYFIETNGWGLFFATEIELLNCQNLIQMYRTTNADVTTSSGGENKPMLAAGLVVGEVIVADIIGKGFYEIHSFGETFVNVKLLKLFGQGWKWRGHITNCHNHPQPINLERWMSYRRVSKPCYK